MSNNKSARYDVGDDGMAYRHQDGDFVLFTDHQEEIVALKKELDNLRQQLTNMTYSNASHREMAETWRTAAVERDALKERLTDTRDALDLCRGFRMVLAEDLEIARAERNRAILETRRELKGTNQAFGTNYSTEKANLMNLPMNPDDLGGDWSSLGMRRPGDF